MTVTRNPWVVEGEAMLAPPAPIQHGPYSPDAGKLARFWLAGPLTLALFVPVLGAGIFGAPTMLIGMAMAFFSLRAGQDSYAHFAFLGFCAGAVTFFLVALSGSDALYIFTLGFVFGPLMAMCFRWIAGRWRVAPKVPRNPQPTLTPPRASTI